METLVAYAAVNKAFSAPDLSTTNSDQIYGHDDHDENNADEGESAFLAGEDVVDGLGNGYKRLVEKSKERSHSFPVSTIEHTKEKRGAKKKDHKSRDEVPSYPREKHRKIICIESTV